MAPRSSRIRIHRKHSEHRRPVMKRYSVIILGAAAIVLALTTWHVSDLFARGGGGGGRGGGGGGGARGGGGGGARPSAGGGARPGGVSPGGARPGGGAA